jgi:hypothetical protein
MAINPFSGIVNSNFKTIFNNAISSMLDSTACTVACTLKYGVTKYDSCSNCIYDPIGKKSSNRFLNGGSIPFPFGGICPLCNGAGKRPVESSEAVNLMVIFDPKQFMDIGTPVDTAGGMIQTMGKKEMTPKMQRANQIVVSTDISGFFSHVYQRVSEPTPMGLGNNEFVICMWKRI